LPELPPTATKLLKTLLDADDPMGRSEIIETTGSLEAVTTATSTSWQLGTSSVISVVGVPERWMY